VFLHEYILSHGASTLTMPVSDPVNQILMEYSFQIHWLP